MKPPPLVTLFGGKPLPDPAEGPPLPLTAAGKANGGLYEDLRPQIVSAMEDESWEPAIRVVSLDLSRTFPIACLGGSSTYAAEQYRIIRTGIVRALKRPFLLAVSSPGVGDGKTFTAANVSAALALTGSGRTLLIDADLRRPSVHGTLGMQPGPGLCEVLAGDLPVQRAIVKCEQLPGLYVLPGGTTCSNPTDRFDSPAWHGLATAVRKRFAHVVVDCPPVSLFGDYDLLSAVCDGVLAVIRPGHTNRSLCAAALVRMQPKLAGVVMNGADDWFLWKKSTRQYYRHYSTNSRS